MACSPPRPAQRAGIAGPSCAPADAPGRRLGPSAFSDGAPGGCLPSCRCSAGALSQREADEYGRLGVARERIHLIAMGVETAATFEVSHDPESPSLRQQVVFLGANTYDKGAFTLALAAAELNRAGLPLHVAFAGPGSEGLKAFLARQPADIRSALADRVQVLGLVDEPTKHRLLASSTLLALPSQVDTFGIVFLEAWLTRNR